MEKGISATWRARRDHKLFGMLDPDEPVWMMEESVDEPKEVVQFTIVHRWAPGGWARRRYSYDMVGDVLHFRGTTAVDDSELAKLKPDQRFTHPSAPR